MVTTRLVGLVVIWCGVVAANQNCPDICTCTQLSHRIQAVCKGSNRPTNGITLPADTIKLEIQDIPITHTDIQAMLRPLHNLEILILSNTAATEFSKEMFVNQKQLKELHLKRSNNVQRIDKEAFHALVNLRVFHISENEKVNLLELERAIRKLPTKNLDIFAFEKQGIDFPGEVLTGRFYRALKDKSLKTYIRRNSHLLLNHAGYSNHIPNITCSMEIGDIIQYRPERLEMFLLTQMRVYDRSVQGTFAEGDLNLEEVCIEPFPESTEIKEINADVMIETEGLIDELCTDVYGLPPNLRFLYYHNINVPYINFVYKGYIKQPFFTNCFNPENKIRYIDVYNIAVDYTRPTIGLLRLQYYNLQNCRISGIPYHTFGHLPSLNTLLLGGNVLRTWFTDGNATFALHKLNKLTSLDFANNDISLISPDDLKFLFTIQHLNLSKNNIHSDMLNITFNGTFKHLNLSHNKIIFLPENFQRSMDDMISRGSNFTIDLSHNPFQCSCEYLQFLQWFVDKAELFHDFEHYNCNVDFKLENLTEIVTRKLTQNCNRHTKLIILSVSLSIALTTVITLLGWYFAIIRKLDYLRFRVYLRFKQIQYRYRGGYTLLRGQYDGEYDAYVMHDERDINFIHHTIYPEMSNRHKSLYSPTIEFTPGLIPDTIVNGLRQCNYALVVSSQNFLNRPWSEFEITMGIVMRKKFVLLIVDEIPQERLAPAQRFLYGSRDVVRFTLNEQITDRFWDDVAAAVSRRDDVFHTNLN